MTFKNVEVIQKEEVHKKTWYERFRKKIGTSAVVATGVAAASTANAAVEIPDFLAPATTALDGIAIGLGVLFLTVIGVVCVIISFTTTKGGIKKAG